MHQSQVMYSPFVHKVQDNAGYAASSRSGYARSSTFPHPTYTSNPSYCSNGVDTSAASKPAAFNANIWKPTTGQPPNGTTEPFGNSMPPPPPLKSVSLNEAQINMLRVPTPMHDPMKSTNWNTAPQPPLEPDVPTYPNVGMESTLERFPPTIPSDFPVGIVLSPFAQELPSTNVGASGMIRCEKCFAYASPYITFQDGQKWTCPFCFTSNAAKMMLDTNQPEFTTGAVDYAAYNQSSLQGSPKKPCFIFLLDTSALAVESGALAAGAQAIRKSLDELAQNPAMLVGLMAYDSDVYFFDVRTKNPKMIAVSSQCEEPFAPDNANFLLPVHEARSGIETVLNSYLPSLVAANCQNSNCFISALKCAITLMAPNGGNLMALTTAYPTCGSESVSPQELQQRMSRGCIVASSSETFRELCVQASMNKISINAFVASDRFCDLASLWPVTSVGGRLRHYSCDVESLEALTADFTKETIIPHAYECVMRVRCSVGWEVEAYYGPMRVTDSRLLTLGSLSADATIAFTLKRREMTADETQIVNQQADRNMLVQVCTSYADNLGRRNLRVHTQRFSVNQNYGDVHPEAMTTVVAHQAIAAAQRGNSVEDGRKYLNTIACNAEREQNRAGRMLAGTASHWESLMYTIFGLLRSPALSPSCKPDSRMRCWAKLATLPSGAVVGMTTPSLWRVEDIVQCDSAAETLPLSSQSLDSAQSYLLFNGMEWLLWNGIHCVDPCNVSVEPLNYSGRAVRKFIDDAHRSWLSDRGALYSITQGSEPTNPWEYTFFASLLEDSCHQQSMNFSYREWVANLAKYRFG